MKEIQSNTDFSELSDLEISSLVHKIIHPLSDKDFYHDYCGCSDYIMPIAIENKIALEPAKATHGMWFGTIKEKDAIKFCGASSNPYRAIAICFLKMQEAKRC